MMKRENFAETLMSHLDVEMRWIEKLSLSRTLKRMKRKVSPHHSQLNWAYDGVSVNLRINVSLYEHQIKLMRFLSLSKMLLDEHEKHNYFYYIKSRHKKLPRDCRMSQNETISKLIQLLMLGHGWAFRIRYLMLWRWKIESSLMKWKQSSNEEIKNRWFCRFLKRTSRRVGDFPLAIITFVYILISHSTL